MGFAGATAIWTRSSNPDRAKYFVPSRSSVLGVFPHAGVRLVHLVSHNITLVTKDQVELVSVSSASSIRSAALAT